MFLYFSTLTKWTVFCSHSKKWLNALYHKALSQFLAINLSITPKQKKKTTLISAVILTQNGKEKIYDLGEVRRDSISQHSLIIYHFILKVLLILARLSNS